MLLELPPDCLALVLLRLGADACRGAVPRACRALRAACWDDALWTRLCARQFGEASRRRVAAGGRIRRQRSVFGLLERWAPRLGRWCVADAYPFGLLADLSWSDDGGVRVRTFELGAAAHRRARLVDITFVERPSGGPQPAGGIEGCCACGEQVRVHLHGQEQDAGGAPAGVPAVCDSARLRVGSASPAGFGGRARAPVQTRFAGERHTPQRFADWSFQR